MGLLLLLARLNACMQFSACTPIYLTTTVAAAAAASAAAVQAGAGIGYASRPWAAGGAR